MRFRALASMISTSNDYSLLKWPLVIISVFITFLALILLLSFQSNAWFTYESFDTIEMSILPNHSLTYFRSLEYGSFGLWESCIGYDRDLTTKCDTWTRRSRPEFFNVFLGLTSFALFLVNLTVFPSWATTILILYNVNNRYIRYIVVFLWILFCLSFLFTVLLISVMILIGISKYYSPGNYYLGTKYMSFHTSTGIFFILLGTVLAVICFLILIISLIWKKFIDMRLIEEEKQLYRQLTEENYPSSWHQVIRIPRTPSVADDDSDEEPPPYSSYRERT